MAKEKIAATITNTKPAPKKVKLAAFFMETGEEFKKVTWPTRKNVSSSIGIVLLIIFALSLFITLIDWGFTKGVSLMIR
ncbi:MAG: preprotein translocase subunit SecE [Candidatus Margulisiibacteriota bacterium]|jgi:preprotein translocase subunit SecE